MIKTNFHTHTIFCDGKDSPLELVKSAIDKGFTALGFSGHSYLEVDKDFVMDLPSQRKYIDEITALKEEYKDKIKIFCGLEQDYYSDKPPFKYDYLIGSVHNLFKDGQYLAVDMSKQVAEKIIKEYFDGDFDAYAELYFETVSDVLNKTNADIIGHFDLISKFFENIETKRYLDSAKKAVEKLASYKKPFEINTGAMSRGYKKHPYPSSNILKMIKEVNGDIIFSSDCHDKEYLDFGYEEAKKLAKSIGFTRQAIINKDGINYIEL